LNDAISHYRRALEIEPSVETHNNLGLALASRGQLDDAIEEYQKALEIEPDFSDSRRNLEAALNKRRQR
jgi:tetratricopeptide (TPR) repeat protein